MVSSSPLLSLGLGLLLAASSSPAVAQSSTSSSSTTMTPDSSSSTTSTVTTVSPPAGVPTSCAVGLQIFVARGSLEDAGVGRMGMVARNISGRVSGSIISALDYPATFTDYFLSVGNGTANLTTAVRDYAARCPNSKMALLGYSQGANVILDMICGNPGTGFSAPKVTDLDGSYEKNIVAIVLYGDPTHAANQTWNEGTAKDAIGYFPRADNAACEPYSPKIRSWCDRGDVYCARGNLTGVHGSYFNNYTTAATNFVVQKFNESQAQQSGSTTTSGGPTSTTSNPASTSRPGSAASTFGRGSASAAFAVAAVGVLYLLA